MSEEKTNQEAEDAVAEESQVSDLTEGDSETAEGESQIAETASQEVDEAEKGLILTEDDEPELIFEEDESEARIVEEPDELTKLKDEVESLKDEQSHLRELYLRKLAEFDNFRKRTEKERHELERVAGEGVIRELVPVLDNFERALQHASGTDTEAFHQGVEMIARQLWDVLQRLGLEEIDPAGKAFEPEYHEAVQRVEDSDQEPGTVVWVLAKGYLFGGRLVRPAMVGVAVEPPAAGTAGPEPESEEGEAEETS
jgi:molecular chaperone GrpE